MTLELTSLFGGAMGQRIGWALIHFLWQGAVVAAVLGVVIQLMQKRSAQARYVLACCALGVMMVLPVVTAAMITPKVAVTATAVPIAPMAEVRERVDRAVEAGIVVDGREKSASAVSASAMAVAPELVRVSWRERVQGRIEAMLPWAMVVWVIGVVGLSLWQMSGWLLVQRIRRMGRPLMEAGVVEIFERLRLRVGVRGAVRLLESALVNTPVVIGWLKPVILLPASALSGLSAKQIEAILVHELAHIRRWDCLVRMIQAVVETVLFFHPAVWWVSGQIRQESENCCDEWALEVCGDREEYARALAIVAGAWGPGARLTAAASGGELLPRLRRILGVRGERSMGRTLVSAGVALLVVVGVIVVPLACSTTARTAAIPLTQERVVAEVEKLGGKITREGNTPDGPVVEIAFRYLMVPNKSTAASDAVLEHLKVFKSLHSLSLGDGRYLTDAGIEHLKDLKTLQFLVLQAEQMTDVGVEHLKGLSQLQTLVLSSSKVTDAGLDCLKDLKQLRELDLDGTKVTDAGVERLKGMNQLQGLSLSSTEVTDAGLEHLKALNQLKSLGLNFTKVTDAGLTHLEGLKQLQRLDLRGTKVTDAGLGHLKGLNQLQNLYLTQTAVTDAGLLHLEGLSKLQTLWLDQSNVTDAGLAHLKGLNQLRYLQLSGPKITDAGLEHLKGMNQLKELSLSGTKVTDQGMKKLYESLPQCRIGITVISGQEPPVNQPATQPATAPKTAAARAGGAEEKKGVVTGVVVDEAGKPVGDAVVEAELDRSRAGMGLAQARTGHNGRFELEDILRTQFVWARNGDGTMQGIVNRWREDTQSMSGEVRIVLKKARAFPVTVKDEKGKAVAGAKVVASMFAEEIGTALTNEAGQAVVRVPAEAQLKYLFAVKPGVGLDYFVFWRKQAVKKDPYHLEADYAGPVAFVLNGVRPVAVKVEDEDHRPLAGAEVYPWYFDKPLKGEHLNRSWPTEISDSQGMAGFLMIPTDVVGKMEFWVRREGYTSPERCVWDPAAKKDEITATLRRMVHVTGRVEGEDGEPAGGVKVRVGGAGYQIDDFRGEVVSGADGTFGIDVDPEKYYIFVAQKEQSVSGPGRQVIHKTATPVTLKLQAGVRVYGKVTAGPNDEAVPKLGVYLHLYDEGYYKLPADEQFPGGTLNRKSISPLVMQYVKTDAEGTFEFYSCAGDLQTDCSLGFDRDVQDFTVGKLPKQVVIHFKSASPVVEKFHGRVVRADKPEAGVGDAILTGVIIDWGKHARLMSPEGVSNPEGNFELGRPFSDMYLYARTEDRKFGAIVLVKPTDDNVTISLVKTGVAHGRVVDGDGKPLAKKKVQYGVRVGPPHGPFSDSFGGTVETKADGTFTLEGLVPEKTYELTHIADIKDGEVDRTEYHFLSTRQVSVKSEEAMELGDLTIVR